MKIILQKLVFGLSTLLVSSTVSAQCPTITCPGDISVNNDSGTCGAVVNYTTPIGTDACAVSTGMNILFVCDGDNTTATEIPTELTAAGYTVTSVYDDHTVTNDNTILQAGGLGVYDVIYWHASGNAGYGAVHNAATFTALTSYVTAGGSVFVTGYDVIASPSDPELITFLGGTTSSDGGTSGTETLVGTNSLTTGVTNIVGLTLAASGDHDGLNNLQAGTVGVATNGTSHGWTIRTLGAGEIALVSSANYTGNPWAYWNTPGSGYNEALLNFASNHTCSGGNILFVCDGDNTTATEIPAELTAAGYTVTSVYDDHTATNDNTILQAGGLGVYDVIYWHASGSNGYGDTHNAATFTALTSYVTTGGSVFVTGYDVIASPSDAELITFLGGISSSDGGTNGSETLVGTNSLTTGVTNIVGLTLAASGDHDGLNNLQAGTVGVATNGTSHGWTIRTLGAGEIALVSSANYTGNPWVYWNTPGSGYNEALLNFAQNHTCGPLVGAPVTTMTAGLADGATFPLGATTVTYEVVDGLGNNPQTCSFVVTVSDNEAPVADIVTLSDVTADCEIMALTNPTATDNCTATLIVTNDATLPIVTQGTTLVTWTYDDGNGNTTTQTQNVILTDAVAPIADVTTLADITAECEVLSLTDPTATDNCAGVVVVTNDAVFPFNTQDTTVVTWTYDDGNGNTSTQIQNVIILDVSAPIADVATLADLTECFEATPTAPSATDNCIGSVIAVSDVTFPITSPGTTIVTWTYDDGNGNTSTQVQNVIINGVETNVTQTGALLSSDAIGAIYQWLDCDNANVIISGETNQTFTPSVSIGNYAVEITENGCVDTSVCYLVDYTGVSELNSENVFIYPNPSNGGNVNIQFQGTVSKFTLYDMSGRVINVPNNIVEGTFDVSTLESGKYLIQIILNDKTITKQVIVL